MASGTVGTTISSFCSGASNATQATAQAAFATALAAQQAAATGPVVILFAGMSLNSATTPLYTYWALTQYVSAV